MNLVGSIIINLTMHGHMSVKFITVCFMTPTFPTLNIHRVHNQKAEHWKKDIK